MRNDPDAVFLRIGGLKGGFLGVCCCGGHLLQQIVLTAVGGSREHHHGFGRANGTDQRIQEELIRPCLVQLFLFRALCLSGQVQQRRCTANACIPQGVIEGKQRGAFIGGHEQASHTAAFGNPCGNFVCVQLSRSLGYQQQVGLGVTLPGVEAAGQGAIREEAKLADGNTDGGGEIHHQLNSTCYLNVQHALCARVGEGFCIYPALVLLCTQGNAFRGGVHAQVDLSAGFLLGNFCCNGQALAPLKGGSGIVDTIPKNIHVKLVFTVRGFNHQLTGSF